MAFASNQLAVSQTEFDRLNDGQKKRVANANEARLSKKRGPIPNNNDSGDDCCFADDSVLFDVGGF
jgi:hypothetical protein